MVVLTAPAVRSYADVARFLRAVRAFIATLPADGVETGAWVAECVARDTPSEEACPLCLSPPDWAVARVASVAAGRRLAPSDEFSVPGPFGAAREYLRALAPGGDACPMCAGAGRLPEVHLHAHLVVHQTRRAPWSDWWRRWRRVLGDDRAWLGVDRRVAQDPAGYLAKAVSEYVCKAAPDPDGSGVDAVAWEVDLAAAQRGVLAACAWYGSFRTRGTWGAWAGEPARPIGTPPPAILPARGLAGEAPPAVAPRARWDDAEGIGGYAPVEGRWLRPAAGEAVTVGFVSPGVCSVSVLGRLNRYAVPVGPDQGHGRSPADSGGGCLPSPDGVAASAELAAWAGCRVERHARHETADWSARPSPLLLMKRHLARGTAPRVRVHVGDAVAVVQSGGDALVVAAGSAFSVPARRNVPRETLAAAVRSAVERWLHARRAAAAAWAVGAVAPAPVHWARALDDALVASGYPVVDAPRARCAP